MKNSMMNNVRLTGYLGSNPEIKRFGDDKSLARVSIATTEYYKNKQGVWMTETQWHNLVMWGKYAVIAEESFVKGLGVSIEGKLINRSFEDRNGVVRYVTEVVVSKVFFSKEEARLKEETMAKETALSH